MRNLMIAVVLVATGIAGIAARSEPLTVGPVTGAPASAADKPLIVFSQVLKDVFGKDLPPTCLENEFDPRTHQPVLDPARPGAPKCKEWGEYTLGYACVVALSSPIPADNGETLDKKYAREALAAKIARAAGDHVPTALSPKEKRLIVDRLDKFDPSRQPFGAAVAVMIARLVDPDSLEEKK